jgi:hypothetical protein
MPIRTVVMRAAMWSGAGTLLAIAANAALGEHVNLIPASFFGAMLGSTIGWVIALRQGCLPTKARE